MTEKVPVKEEGVASSSKENKEEKEHVAIWVIIAVIATVLGSGIPSGYCLGVINTPQEIIRAWVKATVLAHSDHVLTQSEELYLWAVIVSTFVVGAVMGCPLGGFLAHKAGRRLGLFINHILFLLAASLCASCKEADSIYMLIFGRFISGICAGLSSSLMPMYLSEVAPAALRGVMAVLLPSAMCLGLLLSQILGLEYIMGTRECWPYLVGGFGVPVLVALLLQPLLPISPAYCFIVLEDEGRGRKALHRLRGGPSKSTEAEELALRSLMIKNQFKEDGLGLACMVKNEKYRLPMLIVMIFNMGQQFSGINAVFYYSTLIFRSAGLSIEESQGASIGAAAVNWIVSIIAIPLIRYTRRRVLLIYSAALCVIAQGILMTSLALIPTISFASYVSIVALLSFVLVYNLGIGPVPFMIATELFSVGPRSVGISIGSTSNWLSNLIVGLTFPLVQDLIGEYSFICFMVSNSLLWIFTYKFLPETLGKEDLTTSRSPSSLENSSIDAPTEV
ncbi:solute carrier family 2, facilitated glucose transporter member 4-like isoform X1 [Macrobrachium nipponense]|uniref:solute carrier family 2, facilitated glucose transporter member 4-like isoform X1 n=1 Tax=Macrobrachium nipponense TaxID=159736 RepID=UPI0030C85C16